MLLRGTLSNSITFTVINEYGKGGAIEIQTVFWPVYNVACQGFFYNGTFLDIYVTKSFGVRIFGNT